MSLLEEINSPADIRQFDEEKLKILAEEIRQVLIKTTSLNGGHLAPNLGVVELTIALHKVFSSPVDKIIWDVGHQSYVHKLLTGRSSKFSTLRKYKGITGFPNPNESEYDAFISGHSSTSISVAGGMVAARELKGEKYSVVAVIGDGAMTGGMSFEALNYAGHVKKDMIVILNDNEMSISPNVGGMSRYLSKIRTESIYAKKKEDLEMLLKKLPAIGPKVLKMADRLKDSIKYLVLPGVIFEELGFVYLGPVDGHNIEDLVTIMNQAKLIKGPVLIHILTKKGKGYLPSEQNPDKFHGIAPFDIETGEIINTSSTPTYTKIFGKTLINLAQKDKSIVALTAAMPTGTGLSDFFEKYPDRFFDVGIAEQHGVTMAAAMAAKGLKPVVAIYSTFLQRAYDQLLHDVCLPNLPVVLGVDRAGLVGDDGPTHHGVFDLSYLRHMPNMSIMAPRNENILQHMLFTALEYQKGPMAIRYPRGKGIGCPLDKEFKLIPFGRGEILQKGEDILLLGIGSMVEMAFSLSKRLALENIGAMVIDPRFAKPLDEELIIYWAKKIKRIVTIEENILEGGFGSSILELLEKHKIYGIKVKRIGFPAQFVEHGNRNLLLKDYGLDEDGIFLSVKEFLNS